jgi:hypothetical protein
MSFKDKQMPMPYLSRLQGSIKPGQCIFLKGAVTGSTRFDVTLNAGPNVAGAARDDIGLCLSARIDEGKFVMNSFKNGEWGKEEKHKLSLKQGDDFDIRIRALEDAFEIWCNGKEVTKFDYRLALKKVNHIYLVGEMDLNRCAWEGRYYPVPFQTALPPGAVAPGKRLYIAAALDKKAEQFSISLKCVNDAIFHFNPRFKDKKVIRNTCRGGTWDDVEEKDGEFPFSKDKAFDVAIDCEPEQYRVYVDGEEFCTYAHRLPPASADNMVIEGDVEIQGIHW